MTGLKEYLVTIDGLEKNNTFIVSAHDAKDAKELVWNEFLELNDKSKIHSRSLGSLHNEKGKVLCMN